MPLFMQSNQFLKKFKFHSVHNFTNRDTSSGSGYIKKTVLLEHFKVWWNECIVYKCKKFFPKCFKTNIIEATNLWEWIPHPPHVCNCAIRIRMCTAFFISISIFLLVLASYSLWQTYSNDNMFRNLGGLESSIKTHQPLSENRNPFGP